MKNNSHVLVFGDRQIEEIFDKRYINHKNIKLLHKNFSEIFDIEKLLQLYNVEYVFIKKLLIEENNCNLHKLMQLLKFVKIQKGIHVIFVDIFHPSVPINKVIEKEIEENFYLINDVIYGNFKNRITIPLINTKIHQHLMYDYWPSNLYFHTFLSSISEDYLNPQYNIMLRGGKPIHDIRKILLLKSIKADFEKSFINCNFYNQVNDSSDINSLKYDVFKDICNKYGLNEELEKLESSTYLGVSFSKNKSNKRLGRNTQYDINACGEIYTESLTVDLDLIKKYPNMVSFTEKTFQTFASYKIPLPIDTFSNIQYLKEIGFQFPVEPFYIDEYDSFDDLVNGIDKWLSVIKELDIRKLWNDWMFDDKDSPLHNNKFLLNTLSFKNENASISAGYEYTFSIIQYLIMYNIFKKTNPSILEEYVNFDYQSYDILKKLSLIKNNN
jgi:hypothetical protein